MHKKTIVLTMILVALSLIALPAFSTVVLAIAPVEPPLRTSLANRYFRINLIEDYPDPTDEIIFDESEATFVMHGWMCDSSWSEMSAEEKREFLMTASLELTIDNVPVALNRNQWFDKTNDKMYITFWAKFPKYYFEAGETYLFNGDWYLEIDGVVNTLSETVDIIPY